jgi:hypothetical protein
MSQSHMDPQDNLCYEFILAVGKNMQMLWQLRELQKNFTYYSKSHIPVTIDQYD